MAFLFGPEADAVVFILTFALSYGLLTRIKFFDSPSVNALISLAIGLLIIFSAPVVSFIQFIIPSLALYILIVFFIVFILTAMFVPISNIQDYVSHSSFVIAISIGIVFFLILFAFASLSSPSSSSPSSGISSPIHVNPDFLTSLVALIIMVGAVYYMTRRPVEEKSS